MVRAIERIAGLKDPAAFGAWAQRIVVREALDGQRRTRRERGLHEAAELEADPAEIPDPALAAAMRRLSPDRRAVVVLHYWLGHPLPEVADILGIAEGTAHSRLARALAELRELMEVHDGA